MALPDEPTTDTSSAPPPPNLPPNVRVSSPAQTISNRRIPDISDAELVAAFKDKPLYVLDRVNWNKTKSPYRKRLEDLIAKDPSLQKILDHVLPVYPQAAPQPKPQAAPAVAPGVPPPVTATQIVQPAAQPAPGNNITAKNAPKIEAWMNGLKNHVYKSFAQSARREVGTSQRFTQSLLNSLTLYRGGLAGFYLSEGSKELIFSALGPIGDAFRSLYLKDVQRKMSWMKHPLNPDALYYYLTSLPNQMAFKVMYLPAKATFGILARGGAPLISKVHYQESGQTKQSYVFTPLLRAAQFNNKLADGLDKLSGVVTDDFKKYRGEKSRYEQYIEGINQQFGDALKAYKNAKVSGDKAVIKTARDNIKGQLNLHDGKFGQSIFKNGLKNLSRRLRRSSEDPVVGLFALIAGTLIDISIGLAVNLARAIANKIINVIPGLNTLRAQAVEFFSSNRFLNTARIGGATTSSFVKGVFSPTSFSSGYLGAGVGGWVANALGLPVLPGQIIGGGIGYGLGAFYKTSLNIAANPTSLNWIYRYNKLLFKATDINLSVAEQNYWRGQLEKEFLRVDARIANFRPGPLSNFAKFLHENPYARLPVNGFVIADLGVKLFGWNPWIAYPSLIAGDWIWQTRGAWSSAIARWFPTTPLGSWIGNQVLSVQTWFTEKIFMRPIAWETSSLLGKMPVKWGLRPFWQGLQNVWSKIQPYATNVFNPGFFLGINFIPLLTPALGGWAVLAGPVLGSAIWLGYSTIFKAIVGGGPGFISSLSSWGFAGWMIGSIIDLVLPGSQAWLTSLLTFGLPLAGSILTYFGLSFTSVLSGALGWVGTAIPALAGATGAIAASLATWATITSIAAVAGLVVFSGFVIYSAFWVPMQQLSSAGPESTFFSTQTTVTNSNGQVDICSTINVKQDLLTEVNYINHLVYNVFSALTITDFDYRQPNRYVTKATRQNPGSGLVNLAYLDSVSCPGFTNKNYSASFDADFIPLPSLVGLPVHNTYLSTFTSCETGKKTIFELQQMFPQSYGLQQISNGYIDFLNQINEDRNDGNNDNDTKTKLEATLDVINKTIAKFDDVVKLVKDASNQDNLASLQEKISRAYELTETASKPENNPFIGKYDSFEAFQANCNYQESTCRKIYGIYQSYSTFFQSQLSTLTTLKKSADNPSANLAELKKQIEKAFYSLNSALQDLKTQKQSTQDAKDTAIDLYGDDGFWNDWLSILTNISGSQLTEIQNMLLVAFQDVFKKKFYFTPARTVYEVCLKTKWIRPDLLPYTFPVVVYFTNPPAMFNYNYFSPTVNFYTIPAPAP